MQAMKLTTHPEVAQKFESYPQSVQAKMYNLRELIIHTAQDAEDILHLEETLKWGEPSYLAKKGSTLRMDWKNKAPDQYALYFKCTSKLVPTIREVYGDLFKYENNRAIVFFMEDPIPVGQLKDCILMALQYHNIKHLPKLGR